jgi:hypothetical protein
MVLNLWIKWRRQGKEEGEETEHGCVEFIDM